MVRMSKNDPADFDIETSKRTDVDLDIGELRNFGNFEVGTLLARMTTYIFACLKTSWWVLY